MADHERIQALHRSLTAERLRVVEVAAESGLVPPKGLLTYLADLDSAVMAVEAVLEQGVRPTPADHDVG